MIISFDDIGFIIVRRIFRVATFTHRAQLPELGIHRQPMVVAQPPAEFAQHETPQGPGIQIEDVHGVGVAYLDEEGDAVQYNVGTPSLEIAKRVVAQLRDIAARATPPGKREVIMISLSPMSTTGATGLGIPDRV